MGKINFLLEEVVRVVAAGGRGRVLDLGCGDGRTGKRLQAAGFRVDACDMDEARFEFHGTIPFQRMNLKEPLPYADGTFDVVILMEVIEHVYNPVEVIAGIIRVLKPGGRLVLTTPNILHIGSRFQFFFEGGLDFFREPPLDYARVFPAAIQNMHVIPWRYQELEYLLAGQGLRVRGVFTDHVRPSIGALAAVFRPFLCLRAMSRQARARRKGGVDYARIDRLLLSRELLAGRHLILECVKS